MSHKIENKRVRVEVGEDDFTTVQVNDNNVAIIVNPNDKDWIYGEYMRIRRKRVRAVTNVSQQGGSGGGGSEPVINQLYPGVDFLLGLLPDDDIHTIMYDASWSPNYRVWVTDRNSTARQVTGLYTGNSLDTLSFDSVAFDNTNAYCRPGVVFNDTIHGSRFVLVYFGPSGTTDERVGFATSSDQGLTFSDTYGFRLRAGVAPVPSDITRIFPQQVRIIGSTYYLLAVESTDENNISRLVVYSTSQTDFSSWTRHGVILQNNPDGAAWDNQNVGQCDLYFDSTSNRWILIYMGANSSDSVRQLGAAYASETGLLGITSEFVRYSGNPILTEVSTRNNSEAKNSYVGIPVIFDDPVSGRRRYFYRGYFKDQVNGDMDWRMCEALTSNPGAAWYKPFIDSKTGPWLITETTNNDIRYRIGNNTAFNNSLLENITDFDGVRMQIHGSDKSISVNIILGMYTSFAHPTSNTNLYYLILRNVSPFNGIRIVENGAITDLDLTSVGGIAPGDFISIRKDGTNLTYYLNDILFHTGVSTPPTLYPCLTNTSSSLNKEVRNFRILVNRIGS